MTVLKGFVLLLFGVLPIIARAGNAQQYWICADAQGAKTAQDHSCLPNQAIVSEPATAPASGPRAPFAPNRPNDIARVTAARPETNVFRPLITVVRNGILAAMGMLAIVAGLKTFGARRRARGLTSPWSSRFEPAIGSRSRVDAWPDSEIPHHRPAVLKSDQPKPSWWDISLLHSLEWKRFEELCQGFWTLKGHAARLTGPGADGGVDVVISDRTNPSKTFAVAQCKSWKGKVGVEPVRALWGSKDHFGAELAIFYGLGGFTPEATAFAAGKHLKLITGAELLAQIGTLTHADSTSLFQQVTRGDYTTPSCPNCDVKMVRRQGRDGRPDFWGCPNFRRCGARPIPMRVAD